jgi:hypothetical protein
MRKLFGIDPGESTGWASVTLAETGVLKIVEFGISRDLTTHELSDQIADHDLMIVESFLVDPAMSRTGAFDHSDMKTVQVIGALKLQSRLHGTPIVEQSRTVKPLGYGYCRMKYVKGKKGMHSEDAMAHAVFWAVKNAGAKPLGIG